MEKSYKTVWAECLQIIKDNLHGNNEVFNMWFKPIVPLNLENKVLTIQVPSDFFRDWLEEHYIDILGKAIKTKIGPEGMLRYAVVMSQSEPPTVISQPSKGVSRGTLENPAVPVPTNIGKEGDVPNPFLIPRIKKVKVPSQLNESYTLDNFVEGDCNRLARAAGYAVAQRPGTTAFNPILIYGSVGLGKTHLANAIGLKTKEYNPDKTVLYVSSETFMQQFATAGKNGTTADFVRFYQMVDVLIIDDIQFWCNKGPRTQEAFFHIFNHLHQSNKQIIITCDKSPAELAGLEPRLLSRLKWGLQAELQQPDVETRMAILKKKLESEGIDMPHDVIEYIAYNINSNVRELEGALISLIAQSSLNKKQITLELAKQMIDKFVKSTSREITIDYIQKVVCDYFNLPVDSIQSKTRKREIVQARQLTMYFAKKLTKSSLAIIGLQCGNKDHATVLHACKTVANLADTDKQFQSWISDLSKKFKE